MLFYHEKGHRRRFAPPVRRNLPARVGRELRHHRLPFRPPRSRRQEQIKKDGILTGGLKSIVPCDLYVSHGVVSAHEAVGTGFGEDDLAPPGDPRKVMFDPYRSTIPANVEVLEQFNPTP